MKSILVRSCLMLSLAAAAFGGACQTTGPLVCPTDINNSQFGFRLTVPCNFGATTPVTTLASALLQQSYLQDSPRLRLNVFVVPTSSNNQNQSGVTTENLGDTTNTAGVTFERLKITVNGLPGYTVGAGTTLPGGTNQLFIQISGLDNEDAARAALSLVVETVRVTP